MDLHLAQTSLQTKSSWHKDFGADRKGLSSHLGVSAHCHTVGVLLPKQAEVESSPSGTYLLPWVTHSKVTLLSSGPQEQRMAT